MAEETVNNKTFKDLVEEQKKTTTAIRHQTMSTEEKSAEETLEREKSEEKYLKNQERGFKANETRLANLAKSTPTGAEVKETTKETNSYLKSTFSKFLGKGSFLAGKLGGIGESLKEKVTGGIEGIFKALKAGAFVALLIGTAKFLESQTFQDIKDKYLPAITKGLDKLGKTLKNIADGFFTVETDEFGKETYKFDFLAGVKNVFSMIGNAFIAFKDDLLSSFLDENGDLTIKSFLTGIPTAFGKIGVALGAASGLLFLLSPRLFFGATSYVGGKLFGTLLGKKGLIAGGFKLLFGSMTGLTTSLADTSLGMDGRLKKSKTLGGPFGKGVKGIGKGFGRIFRLLGKRGLAGLIVTAGIGMASQLDLSKAKGVFSDTAKGIGGAFKSLFGVLSDFSAKIASVAAKATAKVASVVTKSLANVAEIGAKAAKPVVKIAKTVLSTIPKLKVDPSILKAMKSTPKIPANIIPSQTKIKKPKLNAAQRAAFSGTGEAFLNPKLVTKLSETALKTSIARRVAMVAIKAAPIAGIVAGTIFTGMRLLKGDFLGASMEAGGIFLPSLAGLPVDVALMARDVYKDNYGIFPEKEADKALRYQRMKQIIAAVKTAMPGAAEIDTSSLSTSAPPDFVTNNSSTPTRNLSGLQIAKQSRAGGTLVNAPVTNINNTSNSSNTSVMNRTLVMQDPLLRSAINAM